MSVVINVYASVNHVVLSHIRGSVLFTDLRILWVSKNVQRVRLIFIFIISVAGKKLENLWKNELFDSNQCDNYLSYERRNKAQLEIRLTASASTKSPR